MKTYINYKDNIESKNYQSTWSIQNEIILLSKILLK